MKKYPAVIAVLLFACTQLMAQSGVLFKIKYHPSSTYHEIIAINMDMEMNYEGDTAAVNKMKKGGMQMPMLMQVESNSPVDMVTGAVNATGAIPMTMSMKGNETKITMNGKAMNLPAKATGTVIYGNFGGNGQMNIDSIAGKKGLTDSARAVTSKMMENILSKIKFPDKQMQIGESFIQEIPVEIPIAGLTMKMLSKNTYTLKALVGNKAFFDTKMSMTMDMSGGKMNMGMNGGGDGKMEFNVADNYPSLIGTNAVIDYTVSMPNSKMTMKGHLKMVMNMTTTLAAK